MDEMAKAAFRAAQSVYRADHDHFPLKATWETTNEQVRDGWRRIAGAVLDACLDEHAIAKAIAPHMVEGGTANDAARDVVRYLRRSQT